MPMEPNCLKNWIGLCCVGNEVSLQHCLNDYEWSVLIELISIRDLV